MNKPIHLISALLLLAPIACSTTNPEKTIIGQHWQFSNYRCAFTCQPATENYFKPLLGTPLRFDDSNKNLPSLGQCTNGLLEFNLQKYSTAERLRTYSENLPADMRFTPENTGIFASEVWSGEVACRKADNQKSTALAVVSATASEIIALEEDGMLLVFTPVRR